MSTTNDIDLYQTTTIIIKKNNNHNNNNNDDDDDTTFLHSPVIVCTLKYVCICKRVR
jgi:hypothetical protein